MHRKISEKVENERPCPEVLNAMRQSLGLAWEDILKVLIEKKDILDQNTNFHEKIEECKGKMEALEMLCHDTMIPIEIESVLEYLEKFKHLRITVLNAIAAALKEGKFLIENLKKLEEAGTLDSRPDHIRLEAIKSIRQVEKIQETLHDKRNVLELAWQNRKTQLEQCYTLAVLAKDIIDLEDVLDRHRNELHDSFTLGDSSITVDNLLRGYNLNKSDAISLRDRALKITKATQELVESGCFAGDEASSKAYSVLSSCTEYFDEVDRREMLLQQSKEFFLEAEKALSKLEKLEVEISTQKLKAGSQEIISIHARILKELVGLIEYPVKLGHALLEAVHYAQPDSIGIKRTIEEMENRKIYLENVCSMNSEDNLKVSEALIKFMEKYNSILSWLLSVADVFLRTNKNMGSDLIGSKEFFHLHHQLLADLEVIFVFFFFSSKETVLGEA